MTGLDDVVVLLDVSNVGMDVELFDGDVDVNDGVVEAKASRGKGDVASLSDLEEDDVRVDCDVALR